MMTKMCIDCKQEKPIDHFYRQASGHGGYKGHCKACNAVRSRKWAQEHPARAREICIKSANNHPDLRAASREKYLKNNPGANLKATMRWIERHPERRKEADRKSNAKRLGTVSGRLNNSISCGIRQGIKSGTKANRHWELLVGYSVEELRKHLEAQFREGMSWENYGTEWEIDHRIPKAAFNFETPEDIDFKRCWGLDNLQPLMASENVRKHAKLETPFQPSLAIAAFISGGGGQRKGDKEEPKS